MFDNNPLDLTALIDKLTQHHASYIHACMEAAGSQWEAFANYLADTYHEVSVVNPPLYALGATLGLCQKAALQRGGTDVTIN